MTTLTYTCDTCHTTVPVEAAFVRSVNLRSVAWCRPCWADKHPELPIPAQRGPESAAATTSATPVAQRRWVLGRR